MNTLRVRNVPDDLLNRLQQLARAAGISEEKLVHWRRGALLQGDP